MGPVGGRPSEIDIFTHKFSYTVTQNLTTNSTVNVEKQNTRMVIVKHKRATVNKKAISASPPPPPHFAINFLLWAIVAFSLLFHSRKFLFRIWVTGTMRFE